nr:MAG TPA: hypothetical protein [Caudoviricetes sp.]
MLGSEVLMIVGMVCDCRFLAILYNTHPVFVSFF